MIDPGSPSQNGLCANCRYPLRGLPKPRCPECGQPFDPLNPETFLFDRQRRLLGPISRRLLAPPTWKFHTLCILSSLLVLYGYSVPRVILPVAHAGFFCWLIAITIWIGKLLLSIATELAYRPPFKRSRISWRWLSPPLLVLAVVFLCIFRVPSFIAFAASKPSLDRLAAKGASLPLSQPLTDSWVGVYPVKEIRRIRGGVRIRVTGSYGLGSGFAWFPQGPPSTSEYIYTRISGAWYTWHDSGWANPPPTLESLFKSTY